MFEVITKQEELLRQAMIKSDITQLDSLISDDLQFVLFNGFVASKQLDLESHRTHQVKIKTMVFSEQMIKCFGETASVSVKAEVEGEMGGEAFSGTFRYLRVWLRQDNNQWKVIAGSVAQIS